MSCVFVLGTLGRELGQVGLAHAAHLDKLLSASLVLPRGLKRGPVHLNGIPRIEYLHIELCYLLLDAVGRGCTVQSGPVGGQPVHLHLVAVAPAVPNDPASAHAVRPVVVGLIHVGLHFVAGNGVASRLGPWVVGDVLRGRG